MTDPTKPQTDPNPPQPDQNPDIIPGTTPPPIGDPDDAGGDIADPIPEQPPRI
jgi:hypothetical protein